MEVWLAITCDPGVTNMNTSSQKCKGKSNNHVSTNVFLVLSLQRWTNTLFHFLHRQPGRCHWILILTVQAMNGHEGRSSMSKFFCKEDPDELEYTSQTCPVVDRMGVAQDLIAVKTCKEFATSFYELLLPFLPSTHPHQYHQGYDCIKARSYAKWWCWKNDWSPHAGRGRFNRHLVSNLR